MIRKKDTVFSSLAKLRKIPTNPSLQPVIYACSPVLGPQVNCNSKPKVNLDAVDLISVFVLN